MTWLYFHVCCPLMCKRLPHITCASQPSWLEKVLLVCIGRTRAHLGMTVMSCRSDCMETYGDFRKSRLKYGCGGLTLAGHEVPTKAALSLSSSTGQGTENITKGSWVKIRTGRSLSNYHTITGKTDLTWRKKINLICYQSNWSRIMRNKTKS